MQATVDFTAHVNGADYALKKGEQFKGDARAAAHFKRLGLISASKKPSGKAADNER